MELFLMRHGVAVEGVFPNDDRPLSELGRKDAARTGRLLLSMGERFSHIFASPLLRAYDTATEVAKIQGMVDKIVIKPWLAHGVDAALLLTELSPLPAHSKILVTGHQPDMSVIAALFLGARGGQIAFERGTLAKFSFSGIPSKATGVLEYLLPPGSLEEP